MRQAGTLTCALALGTLLGAWVPRAVGAGVDVTSERIVPEDRVARDIQLRDVRVQDDGAVTGTVVNTTDKRLQDVRLVIRHLWLWNNEFHPGGDDPSRADFYTVPGEIPPGGQVQFTYRPDRPLPARRDGRFETRVAVTSVVEVPTVAESPSRPPTAGVGAPPEPAPYRTAPPGDE